MIEPELKIIFRKFGITKILENLIEWINEPPEEEYLKLTSCNLEKTLEEYKDRYKL